ncbi:MAG: hypothetical protein ABIF10_08490 [Candidatus Woesearchaeota archaeon]
MSDEKPKGDRILLWAILTIIMAVIGVFSIQYLLPTQPTTIDEIIDSTLKGKESENNFLYNNFAFVYANGMWYTRWQKNGNLFTIPLRYNPRQVEDVTITGELDERFVAENLYITFDPRGENFTYLALAAAELSVNLATALDAIPTAACAYNETEACYQRPIVSCQDQDKAVIFLRESEETKVIFGGNCMIIQGKEMNLLKSVDRVLYIWYGIMPRNLGALQ